MTYSSSSSRSLLRSKVTNLSVVDQELSNGVFICIVRRLENRKPDMANQTDGIRLPAFVFEKVKMTQTNKADFEK